MCGNNLIHFHYIAILDPSSGLNPRGQGFHNLGKRLHRHHNHAFSFQQINTLNNTFSLYGNNSPTLEPEPLIKESSYNNFGKGLHGYYNLLLIYSD